MWIIRITHMSVMLMHHLKRVDAIVWSLRYMTLLNHNETGQWLTLRTVTSYQSNS